MKRINHRVLALCVLALVAAAGGCQKKDGANEPANTLEALRETGVARVGFANEAPFAYLDPETGELTGEAPAMARVVLDEIGVSEIKPVLTEFGSLIPGLKAGRFDLIAAGMYITPKRCEQILFSDPTYGLGEGFIVQKGNPKDLHSYADVLENEDVILGVVAGTVEIGYAQALGIPKSRMVVFPDMPSAAAGVAAGRADAFAGTSLTVNDLLSKTTTGKIERAEPFTDPVIDGETVRGYGAFGFRMEDTALRDAFNKHLSGFIGTPAHQKLVNPFGFTENELPGDATAASLCNPSKDAAAMESEEGEDTAAEPAAEGGSEEDISESEGVAK